MNDDVLTVADLANRWKCSDWVIYRLIAAKKLPCFKIGKEYRFTRTGIEQFEKGDNE